MAGSRRKWLIISTFVLIAFAVARNVEGAGPGRLLIEVLDELRASGAPLVYSSALVTREMRVTSLPDPARLPESLAAILAPHQLTIERTASGHFIIVPLTAASNATTGVAFERRPLPVFLDEVTVSPSHYRISRNEPERRVSITRDQLDRTANPANDVYAAARNLPGSAGHELSAKFHIRGGETDDMLVLLDGVEIFEPFHLKDFNNSYSIIGTSAIERVDLLTGGFPAEFGGRIGAVMEIATRKSDETAIDIAPISGLYASGTNAKTNWLLSARASTPTFAPHQYDLVRGELTEYYDLLGRFEHQLTRSTSIAIGGIAAYDDLAFHNAAKDSARARYGSEQVWISARTEWSRALTSRTSITSGQVRRHRYGIANGFDIDDERSYSFTVLDQDWTMELGARHLLKFGVEARDQRASYEHALGSSPRTSFDLSGRSWSGYMAERFAISERIVVEAGARADVDIDDRTELSPRVHLMYTAAPGSTIRGSWGRYFEPQRLNEISVIDGETDGNSQRGEHLVIGLDHRTRRGIGVRLEAYEKQIDRVRPRFENLYGSLELFPELAGDRVRIEPQRATARGLELLVKDFRDETPAWWISYTWSKASDRTDGETVPRSWDQRHAIAFELVRPLLFGFESTLSATYHSGWPTTLATAVVSGDSVILVPQKRNGARLPAYFRVDGGIRKTFHTRLGDIAIQAEAFNLTDRQNVAGVESFSYELGDDGGVTLATAEREWPGVTPAVSLRWAF